MLVKGATGGTTLLVPYHPVQNTDTHLMMKSTQYWHLIFNTLRLRQNCWHFADIFKCTFFNEDAWILITISLKYVTESPVDKNMSIVQEMAWHQTDTKPLPEPTRATRTPAFWGYAPPHDYPCYWFISGPFQPKPKQDTKQVKEPYKL